MKKKHTTYFVIIILIGLLSIIIGMIFLNIKKDKSFSIEKVEYTGDNIEDYESIDNIDLVENCLLDLNNEKVNKYCFLGLDIQIDDNYNKSGVKDDLIIIAVNNGERDISPDNYIDQTKMDISNSNYNKFNYRKTTYKVNDYDIDVVYILYYSDSSRNVGSKLFIHLKNDDNNISIEYILNNQAFSYELVNKLVNNFSIKENQENN